MANMGSSCPFPAVPENAAHARTWHRDTSWEKIRHLHLDRILEHYNSATNRHPALFNKEAVAISIFPNDILLLRITTDQAFLFFHDLPLDRCVSNIAGNNPIFLRTHSLMIKPCTVGHEKTDTFSPATLFIPFEAHPPQAWRLLSSYTCWLHHSSDHQTHLHRPTHQ